MYKGAVTALSTFPVQTQYDVIVLLKHRCLLIWGQIVSNQWHAALWNWIRGRFEFYFSALLDTVQKSWGDLLAPCNSKPSPKLPRTAACFRRHWYRWIIIYLWNIPVFVGRNINLSNETVSHTASPKGFQFPFLTAGSKKKPTSSPLIRCQTRNLNINSDRLYYSTGLPSFAVS